MIVSYRDKRTRDFAAGKRFKAFSGIERPAHLKLDRLAAAVMLGDLAHCPAIGSRLCQWTGADSTASASTTSGGFASNGQKDPGPVNVEIVDYH